MSDTPSARLFVALSQNEKSNIVIRRGPKNQVAVFGWDRKTDTFTLGQWLKGRIYEHRIDISPDGRHWLYLALGRGGKTWTAVARTPYLKALDFYPWGSTWGGGGLFSTSNSYALYAGEIENNHRFDSGLRRLKPLKMRMEKNGIINTIYGLRLKRDGWSDVSSKNDTGRFVERFEKRVSDHWTLRKTLPHKQQKNRSLEHERNALVSHDGAAIIDLPDWEWADVDGRQLVWAANGCLYRGEVDRDGSVIKQKELHDFNAYTFEEKIAPY